MKTRQREVVRDILEGDLMTGGRYLDDYRKVGIGAVATTPLLSRTGALLGLFSAYWLTARDLTPFEARILDIIARQAADLVELQKSRQEAFDLVEKLRRADENRTAFLAALSHELRNPLAAITMGNSLLRTLPPTSAEALLAREIIERQTAQLSHLVDDLLDITQITHNRLVLHKQRVELNRIVSAAVADSQAGAAARAVTVQARLHSSPLYAEVDPERLTQILDNLLNNALKFTPALGMVTARVAADAAEGEAVISVCDTGIGIEPTIAPYLFEPFMQADGPLDRGNGGLGLGLALVKGIVELHGGSVSAASEGRGKGAEFTIRLPLAAIENAQPEQDPRAVAKQARPLRILVIEDNADFAAILAELLAFLGHEATLAASGPDGVAKAQAIRPDVVLCDLGLPAMDGFEVAARLRHSEELGGCYLVAVSGYGQPEDVARSRAAGFDRHVAKPVDLTALAEMLAEVGRAGR
jgi:signal transduction histidine kinase/ActR/RegA family two-component response regulator